VGANIGATVLEYADTFEFIYAVEADPSNFSFLKANISINKKKNIQAFNLLASDSNNEIIFMSDAKYAAGSKILPIIKNSLYFENNPTQLKLKGQILDDYFSKKNINFVIMDIEGSEIPALQGMTKILKKALVLQIEFLPIHIKEVANKNINDFCNLIFPHFNKVIIPSLGLELKISQAFETLNRLYINNISDEGIIFLK
jgi:FkbM family methyltransferase